MTDARQDDARQDDVRQDIDSMRTAGVWRIWEPLYPLHERWSGFGFHLALMTAISAIGLAGYHVTLHFANGRGVTAWDPTNSWDTTVPPLPWSIFIYLTLYLYFPLPILASNRDLRGRRELALLAQGMILLFLISYAFFLFMPAEVGVRTQMEQLVPVMHPRLASLFDIVYYLDRPWNSWPSLHVSESLLIVLFVQRWLGIRADEFPNRRPWMAGLWIAWIALSLSILTTKQHFIWDLITGAVLGALIWWFYILPKLEQRTADREPSSVPTSA